MRRSLLLRASIILTALLVRPLAAPVTAQDADWHSVYDKMSERLADREKDLIKLRHDIHRHPEVSGNEERTAKQIAKRLKKLGFEVRTRIGGHGVVGILRGNRPGPMVAFRADMDAVRSGQPDPVAYRSENPGVRHICGHDIHVTVGVGIAEGFAALQREWAGSIMLIFQPAEETATGAKAMLADGVFASERPDAIYAVHTAPYEVGQLATAPGGMMAGRAGVSVAIRGEGNIAYAAGRVRSEVERVGTLSPQKAMQPAPEGFILVQLFPGTSPDGTGVVVRGQIMTAGAETRERAKTSVLEALAALRFPDVSMEPAYDDRMIAGVTNDSSLVARANAGIRAVEDEISVLTVQNILPAFSEDFGSFQDQVPGVMYFLGVSNPALGTVGMPHAPDYVADDGAILVGARAMIAVMLERLAEP